MKSIALVKINKIKVMKKVIISLKIMSSNFNTKNKIKIFRKRKLEIIHKPSI